MEEVRRWGKEADGERGQIDTIENTVGKMKNEELEEKEESMLGEEE